MDEGKITAAIEKAIDAKVNLFDTAGVYINGHFERILAHLLKRLGLISTCFVIATKMGHYLVTAE